MLLEQVLLPDIHCLSKDTSCFCSMEQWHTCMLSLSYSEVLCKLSTEYLNAPDMQILHFFLGKILKLLTYRTPFLPRKAMLSVVYAVVVCLCVCLSHSCIVSKRLNVELRKQRRTIAP